MGKAKVQNWLQIVSNVGVLVGIVFVVVELRQNQADLRAANEWQLTANSVAVWQPLAENAELAEIEAKVRRGDVLTEVEYIRYEAFVWIRLEQIWAMYQLYQEGIVSAEEYLVAIEPSQERATRDSVFVRIIRSGPMPEDLLRDLLGG